jgi:hypothetical protein
VTAPDLPYQPPTPKSPPPIGLIACGGITQTHLTAYKKAGFNVVALCDLIEERARKRQADFYPDAAVYTDYRDLLARDDIRVVDIATHPPERVPLIEDALRAKKHVLSQKPFVLDLDTASGSSAWLTRTTSIGREPERALGAALGLYPRGHARRAARRPDERALRRPLGPHLG